MNAVYLYKADVPDLANDRFSNNSEYSDYLDSYASPEDLFGSLIYQPQTIDRFSLIHPDYIALEQLLVGTSISNGLRFYAFAPPSNASERILVIRQVLEGSVADNANLQRGQFINQIDGVTITADNVNTLLSQDTYTLHFANYNDNGTPETTDDTFTSNGNTSTLTKTVFTSNPVQLSSIIDVDSEKLGYLLYSAFNSNFNTELNNAFAQFQSNNIQHLVIDLRYNGGGSIDTARLLASMVTGQFNGQVFSKLFFNEDQQQSNRDYKFVNNFDGNSINSLNLNKVYVLTTSSSASASELIINSLKPYITVVQVGDYTTGKTQASTIIYDSPDLGPNNKNPNHNYAMLPLIANSANVNDELVPSNGLMPDILLEEDVLNLNILGNTNEPLLSAVIDDILGIGRPQNAMETPSVSIKKDIKTNPIESLMFIDYLDSEH
ncbi:MAG: peptidase S41 [Gelidibacter sp.]|nr:peptidase S41 [Gelidibacter sp.]